MRLVGLAPVFWLGLVQLGAQTPDWSTAPAAAEVQARVAAKPVVLLWQAGPGAAAFTQAVDKLFVPWPSWTAQAAKAAVFTRARSWDASLPETFPSFPNPKASALVLWTPGSTPIVWTDVPPVLEFSRAVATVSPLPDPYTVDVTGFAWDGGTLNRIDSGPRWTASPGPDWVEEGPVGNLLILVQNSTGKRAAFPLGGDWSFQYDPATQSWAAWNRVVVKRP